MTIKEISKMEYKKICFISSRNIWPVDNGRRYTMDSWCKILFEMGYRITLIVIADGKARSFPKYIETLIPIKKPGKIKSAFSIIFNSFILKREPFQTSLYYSKKIAKKIQIVIDKLNPSYTIFDMARTGKYNKLKNCGMKIMDFDDLISKRYKQQLDFVNSSVSPFGLLNSDLGIFEKILNKPIFQKAILKGESWRMHDYEIKISSFFNYCVFVSKKETEIFNNNALKRNGFCIPFGVDTDYLCKTAFIEKKEYSISFMGSFTSPANIASLNLICQKILPLLDERIVLYVVGNCQNNIRELYKGTNRIVFLGFCSDIREEIKSTEIFVSPLPFGSGIKTKIVEAMAMGVPVITNKIGSEGISCTNNVDIIIEDDYVKIADSINLLIQNKKYLEEMGKKAQQTVLQNNSLNSVRKNLSLIFK